MNFEHLLGPKHPSIIKIVGYIQKPMLKMHVIFFNFRKSPNFINFATSYLVNHSSHRLIFMHFGNEKTSPTNHLEVMNPQKMIVPPYFGALNMRVFFTKHTLLKYQNKEEVSLIGGSSLGDDFLGLFSRLQNV